MPPVNLNNPTFHLLITQFELMLDLQTVLIWAFVANGLLYLLCIRLAMHEFGEHIHVAILPTVHEMHRLPADTTPSWADALCLLLDC